jgi:pentatricopeptide repeat-containing protein PET309
MFPEVLDTKLDEPPPHEVALFAPEGIPQPRKPQVQQTTGQRLEELLRAGGEPDYSAVWSAFISLKEQGMYARAVIRYLSQSPLPVILRRALRTFQMIEVEERTHLTYESAVRAAIGLRNYAAANEFVLEALERGLGVESSQFLMGHLIEKEMWKSAAQALHVFMENFKFKLEDQSIMNQHVLQHMLQAPVWKVVDRMLPLPRILLGLSRRLRDEDAVLAPYRADVEQLATRLLERALRSTTIMGVITPEGVLALLDSFRELGLLSIQHYLDALSALRTLRESRNRSQLALLIFRNMRSSYPTEKFPDSTYGTMISILSAAPNALTAFEYIFEDVTLGHKTRPSRKCDLAMYQRVMSACADQGHTQYVEILLQRLIRDHGVPKDLAYFTPVLLSYAKRGDGQSARRAFDQLSSRYGLQPNEQCWNIVLLAFARADDFEGAAALFREMGRHGVPADAYTFGTLMSMYSNAGDTRALLHLVDMARKQKVVASTAMIDTIVHSYCLNGEVKEAEALVEAATQMTLSGSPTRMWNILLRHHAFRTDSEAVLRTQERMREFAIKPDGMTYAALMTSLVIIGKTKDAAAILRSLHLSQIITASRFHYSIVFHGYVREGRRDQAMVIYAEMLDRFRRPSPSARLAMVHLQSQRDERIAQRQEAEGAAKWVDHVPKPASPLQSHLIDYLADTLLEMADAEPVPYDPQPGFQRRNPFTAAAGLHLEVPVTVLSQLSSYEKAAKLVRRYDAAIKASPMSKQQKSHLTVSLRTAQLRGLIKSFEGSGRSTAHLEKQSFHRIDKIWSHIVTQTISRARERRLDLLDYAYDDESRSAISSSAHSPLPTRASAGSDAIIEPKINLGSTVETPPNQSVPRVIPAKRFALSIPLSAYMRGLALQKRWSKLENLLDDLQNLGFELTGRNWNTYLQLLSTQKESIVKVFCIFEQKMLPNTPPWELLKRGKVLSVKLEESPSADDDTPQKKEEVLSRKRVELQNPGQLIPTYFTVIHLAAAFFQSYRAHLTKSDGDTTSLFDELRSQAPKTVKFLRAMPLLKDRIQGVLLRNRAVKGDLSKQPSKPQLVDRAGLLGSRPLLEGVSSKELDMLKKAENVQKELSSVVEELQHPIPHGTLVPAESTTSQGTDAPMQTTPDQQAPEGMLTEVHQRATAMIATEADGDPYVDGTPASDESSFTVSRKSQRLVRFEKNVEALRQIAELPEPKFKPWSIRSVRRRQGHFRITAYAVNPSKKQLKPQGDYRHKAQLFTKPLLTMQVAKRRQLGSERRTFTKTKEWMDLKKQREKGIRIAQARAKRMRKVRKRNGDLEEQRRPQGVKQHSRSDGLNDSGFLETHLVAPAAEKPHWRSRRNAEPEEAPMLASTSEPTSSSSAEAIAKPKSTSSMPRIPDEPEAGPQLEDPFTPWGQMDMFDEQVFVGPSDHSQDKQGKKP